MFFREKTQENCGIHLRRTLVFNSSIDYQTVPQLDKNITYTSLTGLSSKYFSVIGKTEQSFIVLDLIKILEMPVLSAYK